MIEAIGSANTTHCHGFNRTIAPCLPRLDFYIAIVANIPLMLDRLLADNMANKHVRLLILLAKKATHCERKQYEEG
jgi:hypothetical protein